MARLPKVRIRGEAFAQVAIETPTYVELEPVGGGPRRLLFKHSETRWCVPVWKEKPVEEDQTPAPGSGDPFGNGWSTAEMWWSSPHYLHPCRQDPERWVEFRRQCWNRWRDPGDEKVRCLHRSRMLGVKCNRTWDDPVPWSFRNWQPAKWRKKTRINCGHIKSASRYPKLAWNEENVYPECEWHNERNGTRTEVDPRPGHYVRWREVLKWWLLLPIRIGIGILVGVLTYRPPRVRRRRAYR